MKTIIRTIHVADDYSEHSTEVAALKRDLEIAEVKAAMAPLGPRPSSLSNGDWVQHSLLSIQRAHRAIVALSIPAVKSYPDLLKACHEMPDKVHPRGFMGRLMSELDGPLSTAWNRFGSINMETGKEGNQPFYTANPDRLDGKCVEDRR